jgi:Ca2+-binding EF-hand superfamily protein
MSNTLTTPRTLGLTLTAFGLATVGSMSVAAAHPNHPEPTPVSDNDKYNDKYSDRHNDRDDYWDDEPSDYDLDRDGVLEHAEIDFRHYDRDRNGMLDRGERTAYWSHMIDMGKFGAGLSRSDRVHLARIAHLFDIDGDGRLTREEKQAVTRLIRSRRVFARMDRNSDNNLSRREAGIIRVNRYGYDGYGSDRYGYGQDHYRDGSSWGGFFYWNPLRPRVQPKNWIAARFEVLDRNDNGRVSWTEVESHILASLRRGGRF